MWRVYGASLLLVFSHCSSSLRPSSLLPLRTSSDMIRRPVLLFPYPLQGHITPLFALARCLASSGSLHVIFVHTARNFRKLQGQPIPPNIQLEALDEEEDEAEAEAPRDAAYEHSMQKLEKGLERLLEGLRRRDVFIRAFVADAMLPWTCDAARRAGIRKWYQFSFASAVVILCALNVRSLMEKGLLPFQIGREDETVDCFPVRRLGDLPVDFLSRVDEEQLEVILRISGRFAESAGLLINTVYELEKETVDALRREGVTVYPVGPLLASVDWSADGEGVSLASATSAITTSLLDEDEACLAWLDRQPSSSVLYVAFGSLVELSAQETQQLALALEASGVRFLWALRGSQRDDTTTLVPPGFSTRIRERGLVVGWAPQTRVLAHPSILGFFTHCGFNSVLEALWAGVPMIGLPKIADQNCNLRLITREWGVGIDASAREAGAAAASVQTISASQYIEKVYALDQKAVEKAVLALAFGEEGDRARERALQLRSIIRKAVAKDGVSNAAMHEFVSSLVETAPVEGTESLCTDATSVSQKKCGQA